MFKEIPVNKKSIVQRRLINGVGINDADYITQPIINGKQVACPFYKRWRDMLDRCYSEKFQKRDVSYKGCTLEKEWLRFSSFKLWMQDQDWQGNHLDKDILVSGNKHYSPKTCVFVSPEINQLLKDNKATRGEWPQGVSFHKLTNKFRAYCGVHGKIKHLGLFSTPEQAAAIYKKFKSKHIIKIASQQTDKRLKNGLLFYAEQMST